MTPYDVERDLLKRLERLLPSVLNNPNNHIENYIGKLYNFLYDKRILGDKVIDIYDDEMNVVMGHYVRVYHEPYLNNEIIYGTIQNNLINRMFNRFIYEKYHIDELFNVTFDEMCPYYSSQGVVNFLIRPKQFDTFITPKSEIYEITVEKNIFAVVHDKDIIAIIKNQFNNFISLSVEQFSELKTKYDDTNKKLEELFTNINKDLEVLQEQYIFLTV